MNQGLTFLGGFSIGALLPQVVTLFAGVLAQLNGKLAGALSIDGLLKLNIPSLQLRANALARIAAQISAQAALVPPPSITFKGVANANLISLLEGQISLIGEIEVALATAGIYAWAWDGPTGQLGPVVTGAINSIPGGTAYDHSNALILATAIPACWEAMGKVFLTS